MVDKYKFIGDRNIRISDFPTRSDIQYSKKESKTIIKENVKAIDQIREKIMWDKRYSVLIIFQAIDAAGKDGTIKRVLTGLNGATVSVNSFKKPTSEELAHDFLWRVNKKLPQKGTIGIFNRSHYEEVLVTKVHPNYILYQNIPGIDDVSKIDHDFWEKRYQQINSHESQIASNGTIILKFFLNVSKDEQKKRLLSRIEDPLKRFKFSLNDIEQRDHWNQYMDAFQMMINKTSHSHSPWFVIPADDKKAARVLVTTKIREELEKLDLNLPSYDGDFEIDSKQGIAQLHNS